MKKFLSRILLVVLTAVLTLSAVSCGNNANVSADIVNIGVTDTIPSVNPLLLDASEISKTVSDFQFLPLCELNADLTFTGMLADSITTEDNIHFIVHIHEDAVWSDGKPITADDVIYTVLRYASPVVGNTSMLLYAFEGVDPETGFVKEGATVEDLTGVTKIDEKTVQFTARYEMPLISFQNTYGRYIHVLPKHILETIPEDQLTTHKWFESPAVVSGPYRVTSYDGNHYVTFERNDKYFKGCPNIPKVNIKIQDASQLYAALKSGEIDFIQQTTGNIPHDDYVSIEALENVTAVYGSPITNQSIFIQTANITDVRIRQALLYAMDRQAIVDGLLHGSGEVVDGFLSSASPYYDSSLTPVAYNLEKAKALVAEAVADGWDASRELKFYVNSGDSLFVNAASYIAANAAEAGLKLSIQTVDFSTLMSIAGTTDYDLFAVQYTYPPVDPYADVSWLLSGEGSWTGYANDSINASLSESQSTSDVAKTRACYLNINTIVQQDVPMISAYIISAMGAVNNRVQNASPNVYGSYVNIHEWKIAE